MTPSGHALRSRRPDLLQASRERVAGVQVALLEARGEPLVSLLRRAVRPALGVDLSLDLRLDPVVADRRRRVERLRDIGLRHVGDDLRRRSMVGPYPGEAIGLQLEPDGSAIGTGLAALGPIEDAEHVLDVMAVLVRDHVRLGEPATLRAEARLELVEEPEVEVDRLVDRAVERTHLRRRLPAAGVRCARVEHRVGALVLLTRRLEGAAPVFLDAVHVADDPTVGPLRRVGARLAFLLERGRLGPVRLAAALRPGKRARIAAEQPEGDRQDETEPAAADRKAAAAAPERPAALIADLSGIELGTRIEAHGFTLIVTAFTGADDGFRDPRLGQRCDRTASQSCGGTGPACVLGRRREEHRARRDAASSR